MKSAKRMLGLFPPVPGKRPEALDRLQIATDPVLGARFGFRVVHVAVAGVGTLQGLVLLLTWASGCKGASGPGAPMIEDVPTR
jgi:hypothetical protein